LLLEFAARPLAEDVDKFAAGLLSPQPETTRACVTALQRLPADPQARTIVPAMRLLRRLMFQPTEKAMRERTLALINHLAGRQFKVAETGTDATSLRNIYAPVFLWFANTHPAQVRQLDADDGDDPAQWLQRVRSVDWSRGDAARGKAIYSARGCGLCHDGASPLGPDLVAATGRLSATDLMLSIVFPSREVAAPWRTTHFRMRDGMVFSGLVVFEGNGVVLVLTGSTTNVRLAGSAIVDRWPGTASLMPAGLLRNVSQTGLGDLNAFLQEFRNGR
jgi:putative heme-binding domain-containing protein